MPLSGKEVEAPPSSVVHSCHSPSTGYTEPERVRKIGARARKASHACESQVKGWYLPGIYILLNDDSDHSGKQRGKA